MSEFLHYIPYPVPFQLCDQHKEEIQVRSTNHLNYEINGKTAINFMAMPLLNTIFLHLHKKHHIQSQQQRKMCMCLR